MELRQYPYRAWVINQMGKPKRVTFVDRVGIPNRMDAGDITNKGKKYSINSIFKTKELAQAATTNKESDVHQ